MLGSIKTIWKIGMGVGAAILVGSIGGACYDMHQDSKTAALLDDDNFDDAEDVNVNDAEG